MVKTLKTLPLIIIAMVLVVGAIAWILSGCSKTQESPVSNSVVNDPPAFISGNGNGVPSGAHYDLNLIGVPQGKTADMTGDNGHRIFVPLWDHENNAE